MTSGNFDFFRYCLQSFLVIGGIIIAALCLIFVIAAYAAGGQDEAAGRSPSAEDLKQASDYLRLLPTPNTSAATELMKRLPAPAPLTVGAGQDGRIMIAQDPNVDQGLSRIDDQVFDGIRWRYCVSFSLPDAFLADAVREAKELRSRKIDVRVVFQGFPGGSINSMVKRIGELQKKYRLSDLPFEIDPELFLKAGITRVPQLVGTTQGSEMRNIAGLGLSASIEELSGAAGDLGEWGPTVAIAEENFLTMIERRMQSPEFQARLQGSIDKAVSRAFEARHPLPAATEDRVYLIDPSYTVPEDVHGPSGELLAARGDVYNPADYVPLHGRYVVIDGRDSRQVELALAGDFRQIMLCAGDARDLMKKHRKRFYLAETAVIDRLRIEHVPAVFEQTGRSIRVTELAVDKPIGSNGVRHVQN